MASGSYRFDDFLLDCRDRQLRRGDAPVELNARYLDALALLVREQGRLVSKDQFLGEVWRGVPVTDEALTQCIKTLRRQLGDDAARPRFIETVPKHGYRFIAPVIAADEAEPESSPAYAPRHDWLPLLLLGGAGTAGAGIAGLAGGLVYGFAAPAGAGALSGLLVLMCLTMAVALLGGAGVAFGIAGAELIAHRASAWSIAGGAAGGLIVGAFAKLLGLDAFELLTGHSPGDITGAAEGAALGAAVGLGAWLASRGPRPFALRRSVAMAALAGAIAGALIPLAGGRLLAGSLDLLARSFPGARFRLDGVGALLGETGFGPASQAVTGAFEGALFAGCITGAMILARRRLEDRA